MIKKPVENQVPSEGSAIGTVWAEIQNSKQKRKILTKLHDYTNFEKKEITVHKCKLPKVINKVTRQVKAFIILKICSLFAN